MQSLTKKFCGMWLISISLLLVARILWPDSNSCLCLSYRALASSIVSSQVSPKAAGFELVPRSSRRKFWQLGCSSWRQQRWSLRRPAVSEKLRKMVEGSSPSLTGSKPATSTSVVLKLDSKMVNAEIERLEKMFHEIDTNQDGVIDFNELTEGLRKMGYYHITPEQIEVRPSV